MKNWTTLPHEKLIAYQAARRLLSLVRRLPAGLGARIRSGSMRSPAVCEAAAALDIAAVAGGCAADTADAGAACARRVYALLSGLIR